MRAAGPTVAPYPDISAKCNLLVPMRDGVRLFTDVYLPRDASWPLPTILIRTPYGKHRLVLQRPELVPTFARRGFALVIQDIRGRYRSEGRYRVARGNGPDGCDTLDWIASQSWSSGRVGTLGWSYMADAGYFLARHRHPAHVAMISDGAAPCRRLGGRHGQWGVRFGGALCLSSLVSWFINSGTSVFLQPPAGLPTEQYARVAHLYDPSPTIPDVTLEDVLRDAPLRGALERHGALPSEFDSFAGMLPDDPRWEEYEFFDGDEAVDVPALHIHSWFDAEVAGAFDLAEHFRRAGTTATARKNQFTLISPGLHCATDAGGPDTVVGDRAMGDTSLPYYDFCIEFFDHFVRRGDPGLLAWPKHRVFNIGANRWTNLDRWPPAGACRQQLYLCGDGGISDGRRAGRLELHLSDLPNAQDELIHDPHDPVRAVGGVSWDMSGASRQGPADQRANADRRDVLIYTSQPFVEGLQIAGPLKVVAHVSSTAPDTDVSARLVELLPDGRTLLVQEGIRRCRWRDSFDRPSVDLTPDEIVILEIDLQATCLWVAPGNQLQVHISGSWFPRFDLNRNTGREPFDDDGGVPARNSIHHGGDHASHLQLWTMPNVLASGRENA